MKLRWFVAGAVAIAIVRMATLEGIVAEISLDKDFGPGGPIWNFAVTIHRRLPPALNDGGVPGAGERSREPDVEMEEIPGSPDGGVSWRA